MEKISVMRLQKPAPKQLRNTVSLDMHIAVTPINMPQKKMDINKLLFIKAYALNALEVRTVTKLWEDPNNCESAAASSLEKELELLLFDM